jgi:hypothetical protein
LDRVEINEKIAAKKAANPPAADEGVAVENQGMRHRKRQRLAQIFKLEVPEVQSWSPCVWLKVDTERPADPMGKLTFILQSLPLENRSRERLAALQGMEIEVRRIYHRNKRRRWRKGFVFAKSGGAADAAVRPVEAEERIHCRQSVDHFSARRERDFPGVVDLEIRKDWIRIDVNERSASQ